MRLSRPRLIVIGIMPLIVAAVYYATQKGLKPHPVLAPPAHQSSLGRTSPEFVSSAQTAQTDSSKGENTSSARTAQDLSRRFPESSSVQIEDLRNEITTLEKSMLERQIAMHSLLKSGVIGDPDPEKSDAVISVPGTEGAADETSVLRAKENANSYVEQKAGYLGQKALWKALKEKLRAAELAQKK